MNAPVHFRTPAHFAGCRKTCIICARLISDIEAPHPKPKDCPSVCPRLATISTSSFSIVYIISALLKIKLYLFGILLIYQAAMKAYPKQLNTLGSQGNSLTIHTL